MSINFHCHVLQLHLMPFGGVCKRARDDSSSLECEIGIDRLTQGSVCVRLEDSNDVLRGVIVGMFHKRLLSDWSICIVVGWNGPTVVCFVRSGRCRRERWSALR